MLWLDTFATVAVATSSPAATPSLRTGVRAVCGSAYGAEDELGEKVDS